MGPEGRGHHFVFLNKIVPDNLIAHFFNSLQPPCAWAFEHRLFYKLISSVISVLGSTSLFSFFGFGSFDIVYPVCVRNTFYVSNSWTKSRVPILSTIELYVPKDSLVVQLILHSGRFRPKLTFNRLIMIALNFSFPCICLNIEPLLHSVAWHFVW